MHDVTAALSTKLMRSLQMRRTDIDSLERVVHMLAHGDFDAQLSAYGIEGCRRVLRLCQLAIEYLLYVQGQLAEETSVLKVLHAKTAHAPCRYTIPCCMRLAVERWALYECKLCSALLWSSLTIVACLACVEQFAST
jgi:hypothetical protein